MILPNSTDPAPTRFRERHLLILYCMALPLVALCLLVGCDSNSQTSASASGSAALNPLEVVHVPSAPLAIPELPPGTESLPVPDGTLFVHVFGTDPGPIGFSSIQVEWPQDRGKELNFSGNGYRGTLAIDTVEFRTGQPSNPRMEVKEPFYLYVSGFLKCDAKNASGSMAIQYYGGQYAGGPTILNGMSLVVNLMYKPSDQPTLNIALSDLVQRQWNELGPQVGSRLNFEPGNTTAKAAWDSLAGVKLPEPPSPTDRHIVYLRRIKEAGARDGGGAAFSEPSLIDLDRGTVIPVPSDGEWPEGFDLLWTDAKSPIWKVRPENPLVLATSLNSARGILETIQEARDKVASLDTAFTLVSQSSSLLVRTTENRLGIVRQSGSASSTSLFGKSKHQTSVQWYWLIASSSDDFTSDSAAIPTAGQQDSGIDANLPVGGALMNPPEKE